MMQKEINRLNVESIQDINDVKVWIRDHEIRVDSRMDQLQAGVFEVKKITKYLLYATCGNAVILAIIILLSGIIQIVRNLL